MKRGTLILIFLLLISSFLVGIHAEEVPTDSATLTENSDQQPVAEVTPEETGDSSNNLGNLEAPDPTEINNALTNTKNQINNLFYKELNFPPWADKIAGVIFGLQSGETLDLSTFIIFVCVWVILLLLMINVTRFIPFLEGTKGLITSVVITIILSMIGATKNLAFYFLSLGSFFNIIGSWGPLTVGFSIILLIFIYYALNLLSKIIREKFIVDEAISDAITAGAEIAKLRQLSDTQRKLK